MSPSRLTIILDVPVVLLTIGSGHQHTDVTPNQFAGGVTKHFLRRRVQRLNEAAFIDRDNSLDGRLKNGSQALLAVT